MSKSKEIKIDSMQILENKASLIESIYNGVLIRTSDFLEKRGIYRYPQGLLQFLRHPINYPGDTNKIKLIVQKQLNDTISEWLKEIREAKLTINFVINTILKKIFKRGGNH